MTLPTSAPNSPLLRVAVPNKGSLAQAAAEEHGVVLLDTVAGTTTGSYGDDRGIVVDTGPGLGTKVTLRVPKFAPADP